MPRRGVEFEREKSTNPPTNFGIVLSELKSLFLPFGPSLVGDNGLTSVQAQEISRMSRKAEKIASMHPVNQEKLINAVCNTLISKTPHKMDDQLKADVADFIKRQLKEAIEKDIQEVFDREDAIRFGRRMSEITGRSVLQLLIDANKPGATLLITRT